MKVASIYKITNIVNNKIYIGVTQRKPEKRWWQHTNKKQQEQQKDKLLYRAMNKHGIDKFKFEVIYQSSDFKHTLNEMEPHFIKYYNSFWKTGNGYNLTTGGEGNWGLTMNSNSKELMKQKAIERWKNPEYKTKMINMFRGRKRSEEAKRKTSESLFKYYSIHTNKMFGRTLSDETKKKISEANKGRKASLNVIESARKRESEKWLITFPDGHKQEIVNMRNFCREKNISAENLWKTSKGHIKQHKGYSAIKLSLTSNILLVNP